MISEKYSMFSWDSMRYTVNINKEDLGILEYVLKPIHADCASLMRNRSFTNCDIQLT